MNKDRYDPKKEQKKMNSKKMWDRRVENFKITHQIEFDIYYRQTRFAFLVTPNGWNWTAISVLGLRELGLLKKEIDSVYNEAMLKNKAKRVLKRRK